MSKISVLKDEITNDPDVVGYSAMTDQAIADSLNAPGSKVGPFGIYYIVNYFVLQQNKAAAKEAAQILQLHSGMQIDYTDPLHVMLVTSAMDALIAESLATAADKTAVLALGDGMDKSSRGQEIGAGKVSLGHVQMAKGV